MTTCPACGFQMGDDARFCAMCGERMVAGEPTTTMAPLDDPTPWDIGAPHLYFGGVRPAQNVAEWHKGRRGAVGQT